MEELAKPQQFRAIPVPHAVRNPESAFLIAGRADSGFRSRWSRERPRNDEVVYARASPESRVPSPESRVPSPESRVPSPDFKGDDHAYPPVVDRCIAARFLVVRPGG